MGHNERLIAPSHPWIDFRVDLRSLGHLAWMALGECASKCEHIANTPLRPDIRHKLHLVYLAKGVQATTAIEGNTLSQAEVMARIEGKSSLPASKEYLGLEVDNIIRACNRIGQTVAAGRDEQITVALLCDYNADVLLDLELPEGVVPGRLRRYDVGVGMYRGPGHVYVPKLIERLCRWLNGSDFDMPGLPPSAVGILKAVLAHLYIAWIHPFGDGNGRTARLAELDILMRSGIPSPAAHLLSNHYNATRSEYYRQLDAASCEQTPTGFVKYAIQGFLDGLREQLELVTGQTRDIVWRNYVHERFKEIHSAAARRQRHVVLDLSNQANPVAKAEIPSLTPRLRKAYAGKTDKTLSRDLSKLLKMELLATARGEYFPNRGLIEAFLPMRRNKEQAETESENRK